MSSYTGNSPDYQPGEQASQALANAVRSVVNTSVQDTLYGATQLGNPTAPARSNLYVLGQGGLTDGVMGTTGLANFVAVPVSPGDVISKVSIPIGATAAISPTHHFAALYAGVGAAPVLLTQSPDVLTAAIGASALFTWTFATPFVVTPAVAPSNYIYVEFAITAGTMPTVAVSTSAVAVSYAWFASGPLFLGATAAISVAGTANATIASTTPKATVPIVILT